MSLLIFNTHRRITCDYIVPVLMLQQGGRRIYIRHYLVFDTRSAAILLQATVKIRVLYMEGLKLISVTCLTDIDYGS